MKKSKAIENQDTLDDKASLAAFMQSINPKDKPEVIEILRQKYLSARERHEPNQPSL
ncbi:MAG: hypothetical protein Q8898_09690 [Bacillota bacterium]|nr:hypothetical protein [Bacillota bacterium]